MADPPGDDYSGLPPERPRGERPPPSVGMRTFVAMMVPFAGAVLIVVGALLAAVVSDTDDRGAALAFVEGLSTGFLAAGGIALGLGIVYLAWVVTHPQGRS